MAKWRAVGGNRKYRKWNMWEEDDTIVGIYTGRYDDNYGKQGFLIEIEECTFSNEDETFTEGETFGANTSGGLEYKFKGIPEGSRIQLVYNGQITLDKGQYKGRPCHDIEVNVDRDHKVEIPAPKEEPVFEDETEDLEDQLEL